MKKSSDFTVKILILLQIIMALGSLVLIYYFITPDMSDIWLQPTGLWGNFFWGLIGALILFIPAYLYGRFRTRELLRAVKPLLAICREPLFILLIISFLAGLGEELLFRAFLQQLLGLWPTAFLFMLAHAGFWAVPPHTQARILFAPFSLLAALVLGLLFQEIGLVAAIIAHFLYDAGAFYLLKMKYIQ